MIDADQSASIALEFDAQAECDRIAKALRRQVGPVLRRRGLVLGMSGGVDSSVCAALAVQAVGRDRVCAVFMPEREGSRESVDLARAWADELGIPWILEDVSALLEASGCYARRDEAIRRVIPGYDHDWACRLVLPADRTDTGVLSIFLLEVRAPDGTRQVVRLPAGVYRQVVAATSFKQRTRAMMLYYHADRLHYAVLGTPNRLEYDQGFFVKGGDGLADVKPIAHLFKGEVYALAACLGVPDAVTSRPPTTDTYSLPQTQDEFYFATGTAELDALMSALNRGLDEAAAALATGIDAARVAHVFADIQRKRVTTRYLHLPPLLVEPVPEVAHGAVD